MKTIILAASVIALSALGALDASAQYGPRGPRWEGGHGAPPAGAWHHERPHNWCEEKARRLYQFENVASRDGRISQDERRIAEGLRRDLQASCGGGRWHPNRGWHY